MKRRRGFVLVMTVALIALAAAAMAQLANRSLTVVRRGTMAQHDLQRRWSTASCRISVLERADQIFRLNDDEARNGGVGWPFPNEIRLTVTLDGEPLRIVVRDEQARVNVNKIYQNQPERLFSTISRATLSTSAPVRLRPLPESSAPGFRRFLSWGQVIDVGRVRRETSLRRVITPITHTFTCWGDGRTNICRASDESLRLAVSDILNIAEVEELLQLRRGYNGSAEGIWTTLDVHRRTQLRLSEVVTEESRCYSLEMSRRSAKRESMTLIVHDPSDRTRSPMKVFDW